MTKPKSMYDQPGLCQEPGRSEMLVGGLKQKNYEMVKSSDDAVLKRMRWGLCSKGIKKRINELRDVNPDIVLRTSIIVGFPGENEDDFQKLYNMVEETQFDHLGVFIYSEEKGTHAAALNDDVPIKVKTDRMDAIMMLQQEINLKKMRHL